MNLKRWLVTIGIVLLATGLMLSQLLLHARDVNLADWYEGAEGYTRAIADSKASMRPVAIFFHADWCKSCKSLRETVLSTKEVRQYLSGMIRVKIEPEKSYEARAIADRYGVAGFPTFIIQQAAGGRSRYIRKLSNISSRQFIDQCDKALQLMN